LIVGVSGSGKTTLGKALALQLGWDFFDGDDFHPAENIAKMINGILLSDSDCAPQLALLYPEIES
jgi:gluconokinase